MNTRSVALSLSLLTSAFAGCGDDDVGTDASAPDALGLMDAARDTGNETGTADDAGGVDSAVMDAFTDTADAADAAADTNVDAGFGTSCEGACAETRLEALFGDATELFDVAYFGFNADESVRVEAYGGAADGCPETDSPSPDRTLIIGALPAPTDSAEVTLTASLLDFEGTLTPEPFLSTPMASVRAASAQLMPLEMAFVRVDFDASFDGGAVAGGIYATHCTSLDE